MATRKQFQPAHASSTSMGSDKLGVGAGPRTEKLIGEFSWDVAAINTFLEEIRRTWAEVLGVSGPQWLILMAISDLDRGEGVSVGEVSAKLNVHSTFVTTQTKVLERHGFLARETSPLDARVVLMSLTNKARKEIARLEARRKTVNDFIFADLTDKALGETTETLALIRRRVERAALQLNLERSQADK